MKNHARTASIFGGGLCLFVAARILSAPVEPALLTGAIRSSATGAGASFAPAFSGDGRYVIFHTQAKDLITNGVPSLFLDLYVRDLAENKTILVSANTQGTGGGDGNSRAAAISRDGRWIAFESEATNLVPNDTNGFGDIFLRDLTQRTTVVLSRSTNGLAPANRTSRLPLISASGQSVVFESVASDLVTNDLNAATRDVFLWDSREGTSGLVSVNAAGTGSPWPGFSSAASLSADGQFIAYFTTANQRRRRLFELGEHHRAGHPGELQHLGRRGVS